VRCLSAGHGVAQRGRERARRCLAGRWPMRCRARGSDVLPDAANVRERCEREERRRGVRFCGF
jgi:hypothetical protein